VFSRSSLAALAGALASVVLLAAAPSAGARLPRDFFGIGPQTPINEADVNRMRHGGLDVVRVPVGWGTVQPTPTRFEWGELDRIVAVTARARLSVLPFLYGTPRWVARRGTTLPIDNARQRRAWAAFVSAAVERYGRYGTYWQEHGFSSGDYVPRRPIRTWQIWNEENFFYFARPASPRRYARLLKGTYRAVRRADPGADIVLGGLFGNPRERPPRAMAAADFLDRLYRVRGIRRTFDGVALHPYARDTRELRRQTEGLRRVLIRHRDRRTGLYITEMGWGSNYNPRRVAFEVGRRAQARELRRSYRYLIRGQRRLNLKQVFWFSWKDAHGLCNFCDSVGLFHRGERFRPKPAWHALVRIAR
jgi:hypothetical protein